MDSLGGILIKGLLGNPILGRFNLGLFGIEVVEPPRVWEAGGAGGAVGRRTNPFAEATKKKKQLVVSLRLNGEVHKKAFDISDRTAHVSINTIKLLNSVKDATLNIFVRKKDEATLNPVVRIKDD